MFKLGHWRCCICRRYFIPDDGTAPCDFPKGGAATLFDSVKKLYQLDENIRIFFCHDYLPEGRLEYSCQSRIQAQKSSNIHINAQTAKAVFVEMRNRRDATLSMPKLIYRQFRSIWKGQIS